MIKWKFTFFLMLITFILSFFLFYEINNNKNNVQNSVKLIPYDISNLISLNFINSSNNIYCKKINDDWFINSTNDKLQKADSLIIQRILKSLEKISLYPNIKLSELNQSKLSLSDFGLDDTSDKILLDFGFKQIQISIGSNHKLSSDIYFLKTDIDYILSGSSKILNFIPRNINSIKDMNIMPNISQEVQRISINSKSKYVEIVKKSENEWNLIQPRRGVLKGIEVNSFIDKLSSYRLIDLTDKEIIDYSIDENEYEVVEVSFQGIADELYTFSIMNKSSLDKNYVYLNIGGENQIGKCDVSLLKFINFSLDNFLKSKVFDFTIFKPVAFTFETDKHEINLSKNNNDIWEMKAPFFWNLDQKALDEFILFVDNMRITKFNVPNDKNYKTSNLLIESDDGKKEKIIFFESDDTDDLLLIKFFDEPFYHEINIKHSFNKFLNPLFFKDTYLFSFSIENIKSLKRIINDDKSLEKIYDFSNGIDVEFVNSLINIRADKYVAAYPSALENFGLKDPWGIFQFRFSNLDILGLDLLIGKKTIGGRFAMIKGRDIVFVLSDETLSKIII